ncbi:hypothetical protein [Vibrio sp. YIC-376]
MPPVLETNPLYLVTMQHLDSEPGIVRGGSADEDADYVDLLGSPSCRGV